MRVALHITAAVIFFLGFFTATTSFGQGLSVASVRLLFDNGKPVLTLAPGDKVVAHAVVQYRGVGLFEGQWKVNGRLLAKTHKQVVGGRSFTVTTPSVPPLPTEQIGPYQVVFSVITPKGNVEKLSLTYHVMGK